jgi:hypothetical protein
VLPQKRQKATFDIFFCCVLPTGISINEWCLQG